jgi:hypothetical protein
MIKKSIDWLNAPMSDRMNKVYKALVFGVVGLPILGITFSTIIKQAAATKDRPAQVRALPTAEQLAERQATSEEIDARVACKRAVERQAKYDLRWTSWLSDFQVARDPRNGHIVLVGDEAQAQNGFGAWVRMSYGCSYDPRSKRLLEAYLQPGRLRR